MHIIDVLNGNRHLVHSIVESNNAKTSRCLRHVSTVVDPASESSSSSIVQSTPSSSVSSVRAESERQVDDDVMKAAALFLHAFSQAILPNDDNDSEEEETSSGNDIDDETALSSERPTRSSTTTESSEEGCDIVDNNSSSTTSPTTDMTAGGNEEILPLELECIVSLVKTIKEVFNKNASPFVFDEIIKVVRLIDKDPDITLLYETITTKTLWCMAISQYAAPVYEHAAFGIIHYGLDCPLDRIVYAILVSQSLTVMYNTYKSWMTLERINSITSVIITLDVIRRSIRRSNDPYKANVIASRKCACENRTIFFAENMHALLHETVIEVLQQWDMDVVESVVQSHVSLFKNKVDKMVEHFQEMRERLLMREERLAREETTTTTTMSNRAHSGVSPSEFTAAATDSSVNNGHLCASRVTHERRRTRALSRTKYP